MGRRISSWAEVGALLAQARKAAGLTQGDLGLEVGLDRTAISKIESGQRTVDSLELGRIARALKRPVEWFVSPPPPAVVSRRAARDVSGDLTADVLLEGLARDVELLVELGVLSPPERRPLGCMVSTAEEAEQVAGLARGWLHQPDGPLRELLRVAEYLGLYAASLDLHDEKLDGSYVALEKGGAAIINGAAPNGRRRFTLVHELGHHLLADSYSAEWIVCSDSEARESLVNAFAIHFLMPRRCVVAEWESRGGPDQPRTAAIAIGARFGVSWTATCAHLRNLKLIDERLRSVLVEQRPRAADYLEMELSIEEDLRPPAIPPGFSAAVIKAYRRHKISTERALELLRHTIGPDDLPDVHGVPLDSMHDDLSPIEE